MKSSKVAENRSVKSRKLSKYELLKTSWTYQIKEFFNQSNLHGVRFIAEKGRPFHEKFLWFGFVLFGLLITLVIVSSLWEKFQTGPTITSLDSDFRGWYIPFPSITLCPQDPTDPELVKKYIVDQWGENIERDKYEYYRNFIIQVANLSYENFGNVLQYKMDSKLNELNLKNVVAAVVTRCNKFLYDCLWKGDQDECCGIFLPVYTDHGFCYTFNSKFFNRDFPTLNGTRNLRNMKTKYIYETDTDLSIKFRANNVDNNPVSVYIHSLAEKIASDLLPHHVWTRQISTLLFSPKETYTTEYARQLSIYQRHCVFPDEIRLITDEIYTFSGCMSQCRMNMARERCGCIPFFYRQIGGYRYCDLNGLGCVARFRKEIQNAFACKCHLGCENTVYEIERLKQSKDGDADDDLLEIGFMSWPAIRYKRDVLFGWVDFFVAIGGIAGLFLGFSVLSLVEIIYFFTIRAVCMVYREENRLEKLHKEYGESKEPEIDLNLNPYFLSKSNKQAPGNVNEGCKGNDGVFYQYLP